MASTTTSTTDWSAYPTVFDPDTLVQKGLCPVTELHKKGRRGRAEPQSRASAILPEGHSLYFEIHGKGTQKVVLIMGLNATSFHWQHFVETLMTFKESDGTDTYSVLVFDNRGVGNSGVPKGPYRSTSGMANDVITLLDHIGWTSPRQLHVVGVSMGGMIGLELASRIAPRIVTLGLVVTSAGGWNNFSPWKGAVGLTRLTFTSDPDAKTDVVLNLLYPQEFLNSPATEYDKPELTYAEVLKPVVAHRMQITRPQTLYGAFSQVVAGLTHRVSADRLAKISRSIPKILILTGDEDNLVRPKQSWHLKQCMPEAEYIVLDKTGHSPFGQHPKRVPQLLKRTFDEGWELVEPDKPI